ncbi:MAG: hypothetical protein K9J16_04825 [Melioribacteraceae bacterium]|nr:hypothetical protein [Melioribacteraceae bacterium]MCF8355796.1 hypothetical protein [Melioribacteraceae bacterium]MCF8392814.1 hypothetical protein [Melioribacteraceae bacterium]MCF8418700.1 hypothetical protein [Melioribacteraceae bacterium]
MNNGINDKKIDKIALIYEFNNRSPLFARVAKNLLSENKVDKAIDIIENGIKNFPEYSTGYLIYSLALASAGRYDDAYIQLNYASDFLFNEELVKQYSGFIKEIQFKDTGFVETNRGKFTDFETPAETVIEEKLDELVDELSSAKIPQPEASRDSISAFDVDFKFDNNYIVSETLANIYLSQGNLKEAKAQFEKLISMHPAKEDHFQKKIDEIVDLMKKRP